MINEFICRVALLFATAVLVMVGCSSDGLSSAELKEDGVLAATRIDDSEPAKRGRVNAGVAVPFKANFYTMGGEFPDEHDDCPAEEGRDIGLNVQTGEGQSTHLGRFDVEIRFCMDFTDVRNDVTGPNGEPLVDGESIPYWDGVGIFVAANGDELHFTIEGAVLPSDHPDYLLEFFDEFVFTDGTGKFSGASGTGETSSFVLPPQTDHYWTGTLILPRGR